MVISRAESVTEKEIPSRRAISDICAKSAPTWLGVGLGLGLGLGLN